MSFPRLRHSSRTPAPSCSNPSSPTARRFSLASRSSNGEARSHHLCEVFALHGHQCSPRAGGYSSAPAPAPATAPPPPSQWARRSPGQWPAVGRSPELVAEIGGKGQERGPGSLSQRLSPSKGRPRGATEWSPPGKTEIPGGTTPLQRHCLEDPGRHGRARQHRRARGP